jgi:signal transduction histidine kinase
MAFPRPLITAILVFLAGLVVNGAFYLVESFDHRDRAAAHFADDASVVVDRIDQAIHHGADRLIAAQGLFEAADQVTASEFLVFAQRLGPGDALTSIGYAPLVPDAELDAFVERMQRTDPGFAAYEPDAAGDPIDVRSRSEHYPVVAELGFGDLPTVVGFDLASEPVRAAAIAASIDLGEPVVSGFVDLPGDQQAGDVKIVAPVRTVGRRLLGVVFASMQIDELVDEVATYGLDQPMGWQLTDLTDQEAATAQPIREPTRWAEVLEVRGRHWLLSLTTETDHLAFDAARDRLMLVMGVGGALLAAILGFFIAKSRHSRLELDRMREMSRSKDRFLAGVSHQIRTPLTSVLGMTGILANAWRSLPPDEVQDLLDIVEDQGAELSDRVDDLLTIGNISAGTLSVRHDRVELGPEIDHVTARVTVPHGKEVRERGERGAAVGDRLRIRQIFRNLYTNALRYAEHTVQIVIHREGDRIQLCVCNDGPPLDEEKQRRVFQPYVDERRQGQPATIGAGLWLSRTLAEAMGGSLTYRNVGGRSVFTLELFAHDEAIPASAEQAEPMVPSRSRAP